MSLAYQVKRLQNIKKSIREILTSKDIADASTHNMEDFPSDIEKLSNTSLASATADDVLETATFVDSKGVMQNGSIVERTTTSESVKSGLGDKTLTYESGYYPNSFTVRVGSAKELKPFERDRIEKDELYISTTDGVAVESLKTLMPISRGTNITAGDVYVALNDGIAFDSINEVTPTESGKGGVMFGGYVYKATDNAVAVSVPLTQLEPTASGNEFTKDKIYKASSNGLAITPPTPVTPTASGTPISANTIYKIGDGDGLAITTPPTLTPTATGTSFSPNTIYRTGNTAGLALSGLPFELTPSGTGESITSGALYRAMGRGVAVSSLTNITPSATPTSVSNGSNYHMNANGFLYNTMQFNKLVWSGQAWKSGSGNNNSGLNASAESFVDSEYFSKDSSNQITAKKTFYAKIIFMSKIASDSTTSATSHYGILYLTRNGTQNTIIDLSTKTGTHKQDILDNYTINSGDIFTALQHANGTASVRTLLIFAGN